MKELKYFLYREENHIGILTVNRPEVRNALNPECWDELNEFVRHVNASEEVRLAIITGAGEKAFVAGADVKSMKKRTVLTILDGYAQQTLRNIAACNKPIIAAINGAAFGAGCELALACDIRIAVEHAKIGLPELGLGIIPGTGGTQRLAKLIGLGRAKEMIFTGRAVEAEEALRIGLVSSVVPANKLMETVMETANMILSKGPLAVRLAKKAIDASMSTDEDAGMLLELLSYTVAFGSEDRLEGTAAFAEKRKPEFQGR